ncbi:hypothetical protein [Streptomyces sp. NPDC000878]
MTADARTGTGDAKHYPLRARCCGLPAGERGPARTAHSTPDTLDGKAAP